MRHSAATCAAHGVLCFWQRHFFALPQADTCRCVHALLGPIGYLRVSLLVLLPSHGWAWNAAAGKDPGARLTLASLGMLTLASLGMLLMGLGSR